MRTVVLLEEVDVLVVRLVEVLREVLVPAVELGR